jgi:Predicted permease
MQLALNAAFGLIIGVGLWAIGVPSAPLWGLLAMVLRFVPYIGAVVAAIFPLIVATAVDPGWSMMLMTAALFLIVEPLIGHVIEPMVYGHSSGLSPVAVVVSATFWTWLWGPIGLILATPLTVCLVVLGRHVEHLKFLEVLLSDRPALSPSENAYQRMLAGDPIEATEQAQSLLKDRTLDRVLRANIDGRSQAGVGRLAARSVGSTGGAAYSQHSFRTCRGFGESQRLATGSFRRWSSTGEAQTIGGHRLSRGFTIASDQSG